MSKLEESKNRWETMEKLQNSCRFESERIGELIPSAIFQPSNSDGQLWLVRVKGFVIGIYNTLTCKYQIAKPDGKMLKAKVGDLSEFFDQLVKRQKKAPADQK